MAIRNGQKKGAHCHLPTITNAIPLIHRIINQEADYLAIFINLHLSSWIKQRPGRRLDYTYSRLTKDFLPYDKNFHSVQARVQFVF